MGRLLDHVASVLGARRSPPVGAPISHCFETLLRHHEDERHQQILEPLTYVSVPSRNPPGFRAEDVLRLPRSSGFVPLRRAATVMGMTEEEIVRMVAEGLLEAKRGGLVRPAVVSLLTVIDKREQ